MKSKPKPKPKTYVVVCGTCCQEYEVAGYVRDFYCDTCGSLIHAMAQIQAEKKEHQDGHFLRKD